MANYALRIGFNRSYNLVASSGAYQLNGNDALLNWSGANFPLLANSAPTPNWSRVSTKDFEDNTVSGAEFFTTTGNIRSVITTNPISGARSQRIGCTGFPGGARCAAIFDFATWLNSASRNQGRFRASVKVKAESGSTTIFLGVCQSGTTNYVAYERLVVDTTPKTFIWEFMWPFSGNGTLRVDMTEATVIVVDDAILDQDLTFTGAISIDDVNLVIPADGFGIHANQAHVSGSQSGPGVGYTSLRTHALCNHYYGEVTEGVYTNTYLNANAAAAQAHSNCVIMHNLAYLREWITTGAVRTEVPMASKMTAYKNYLTHAITRYEAGAPGRLKYLEGWNEVDAASSYTGTMADMVAFQIEMYNWKQTNYPSLTYLAPNFTHLGQRHADDFFRLLGGATPFDGVSLHAYHSLVGRRGIISAAYNLRSVMRKWSVSDTVKIWHTETCTSANPGVAEFAATMLTSFAVGLQSYHWYVGEGLYAAGTALYDGTNNENNTTLGDAFNRIKSWLSGHSRAGFFHDEALGVWHLVLNKSGGGKRVIVWAETDNINVLGQASWGLTTSMTIDGLTTNLAVNGANPILPVGTSPKMFE